MQAEELADAKRALRKAMGKTRAGLEAAHGADARQQLGVAGLSFLGPDASGVVSGFYPYGSEIDCTGLLERLSGEGWVTALPVVMSGRISRSGSGPGRQAKSCWNPAPGRYRCRLESAPHVEPDVLLVPLLAYDRHGYRLGYGGGFYDRTLGRLRAQKPVTAIGVAFAGQEVETVPHDTHDQPLDWMLTERGPVQFAQARGSTPLVGKS